MFSRLTPPTVQVVKSDRPSQSDRLYTGLLLAIVGGLVVSALHFILTTVGMSEVIKAFGLGLLTLARVTLLLIVATLIWTPLGVAIGFNPRLARLLQPVVQFLTAFPANFIFPFATLFFIRSHISLDWGSIFLMSLIVAEIVSWGQTTLTATGLGSYIAEATATGDWARITLGIGMMSLFVVGLNRLLWRRLYQLTETKYHL